MTSLILAVATRLLLPLLLIFSVFLLLRGHSEPGGGFVAGLVAAAALALYAFASTVESARNALRLDPITIIGSGLLLAIASAALPLAFGLPFFTVLWYPYEIPAIGEVGTAFTFDVGVYLVVIGVVMTIVFEMADDDN